MAEGPQAMAEGPRAVADGPRAVAEGPRAVEGAPKGVDWGPQAAEVGSEAVEGRPKAARLGCKRCRARQSGHAPRTPAVKRAPCGEGRWIRCHTLVALQVRHFPAFAVI